MHVAAYFVFWSLGGACGLAAMVLTLRARGVLSARTLAVLPLIAIGVPLGGHWQMRLESMDVWTALLIPPQTLLDPVGRLPLGFVTAGVLALVYCLVLRIPWRDIGDALSVGAAAFVPIGRIGCLTAGCCMGDVCGRWLRPFCVSFPPGSSAFADQVSRGLLDPSAAQSLPVHLLPVYFALASLAILGVLCWLLRRGAAPGMLLLTFCILNSISRIGLESLRASPRVQALQIGIPSGVLLVATSVLLVIGIRRARTREMPRPSMQDTSQCPRNGCTEAMP